MASLPRTKGYLVFASHPKHNAFNSEMFSQLISYQLVQWVHLQSLFNSGWHSVLIEKYPMEKCYLEKIPPDTYKTSNLICKVGYFLILCISLQSDFTIIFCELNQRSS